MNFGIEKAWAILLEELMTWFELAIKGIPNLILAIFIVCLFIFIAGALKKALVKISPRLTKNRAVQNLLSSSTYVSILVVGIFISLSVLELEKTVTSLLAGAGLIGLALGFAFQEIAANFVSGILIAFREPYQIGDIIEIDNYMGEVIDITLRTTSIMTFQGLEVIVPNKDMFTKPFINYTTTPKRRIDLLVGVSYSDDLRHVECIVKQALERVKGRLSSQAPEVFYKEFGDSSINFEARIWIKYPGDNNFLKARNEAIINIKEAFDNNNITIPFPIRSLDFDLPENKKVFKPVAEVLEKTGFQ